MFPYFQEGFTMCHSQTCYPKDKTWLTIHLSRGFLSFWLPEPQCLENTYRVFWWATGEHVQGFLEDMRDQESGQRGSVMLIFKKGKQKPAIFISIPRKMQQQIIRLFISTWKITIKSLNSQHTSVENQSCQTNLISFCDEIPGPLRTESK